MVAEPKNYGIIGGGFKIAKDTVVGTVGTGVKTGAKVGLLSGGLTFGAGTLASLGLAAVAGLGVLGAAVLFPPVGIVLGAIGVSTAAVALGAATIAGLGGMAVNLVASPFIGAGAGLTGAAGGAVAGGIGNVIGSTTQVVQSRKAVNTQKSADLAADAQGRENARRRVIAEMQQGNTLSGVSLSANVAGEEQPSMIEQRVKEIRASREGQANLTKGEQVIANNAERGASAQIG